MKRIILALIFSINLFAQCMEYTSVYSNGVNDLNGYSSATAVSLFNRTYNAAELTNCQNLYEGKAADLAGPNIWSHDVKVNPNGTKYSCGGKMSYGVPKTCPSGLTLNENCECISNTCSWATNPPYIANWYNQSECGNHNKIGTSGNIYYSWNFSWCESDQICYGRKYFCPTGQIYDSFEKICRTPKDPYSTDCSTCGYYKTTGSVTNAQTGDKICFIKYTCKCNPKITFETEVSCGSGPVDDNPEINPDAPVIQPDEPHDPTINQTNSTKCGTYKMLAKASCDAYPGKILKFECDPLTGTYASSCTDPLEPLQQTINPGDDSKGSTTEDIKNLMNTLPASIKSALSNYLSDGSSPYLQSIKGSLESTMMLDAARNDKLASISASSDAALILQSDANSKLEGIKTSADGIKASVDSQKPTMDKILEFFNDDTEFVGEEMPTNGDMSPDSNTTDGFDTFTNSIEAVQNQFDTAQTIFSGGVPGIVFQSGSCPTYSFMGKSVSISSIGQSIAPYSSIFSILIYISLMINIFRMIFGFFSKGV